MVFPFIIVDGLEASPMRTNAKVFDIVVLAGMVVNILLAVFLILYYFDFLG